MKRFFREAAIPLIIAASYSGYHLAQSEPVQAFVSDARSRIEQLYDGFRERQEERGAAVRNAFEHYVANVQAERASQHEPEPRTPSSSIPDLTLARPERAQAKSTYDAIDARMAPTRNESDDPPEATARDTIEAHAMPLLDESEPAQSGSPERASEPVLEHVIETNPRYALSEWQTSTLARMKPVEALVEGIARRFDTDPTTVYATLIVESSLNPIATNPEEDKHGLAQVRPAILEQLIAVDGADPDVSLFSAKDNLDVYSTSLDWIAHETGVDDFVTLSAIHSYTGQQLLLDEYLDSDHLARYRELVTNRIPFVDSIIGTCDGPDDDLETICSIDGDVARRYRALTDASIERAADTIGMRSAVHYANAVLSLRAYEETSGIRPVSRAELARLRGRLELGSDEARAYADDAAAHLRDPLGERYTIETPEPMPEPTLETQNERSGIEFDAVDNLLSMIPRPSRAEIDRLVNALTGPLDPSHWR